MTEFKEPDNLTIIVEDFNIPLSIIHGKTRQKISKDTENLNNTIKSGHYKTQHLISAE